jgi:hypothetical protein
MKNNRKRPRAVSAEAVARQAEKGESVSPFFTNSGQMIVPVRSKKSVNQKRNQSDRPRPRPRAEWKEDFYRAMQQLAIALGDISEEEVLQTIQEYREERKKLLLKRAARRDK